MVKAKNIKENVTLILGSVLFSLLLLEISLRIGGSVYIFVQNYKNQEGLNGSKTYKILCLGESSTALGGKYSYPKQLENILNEKRRDLDFKLINKGIPGITSSYIVSKVDGYLQQYNPDMVVVMMGINDFADDRAEYQESFGVKLKDFFAEMRTYKLFCLLNSSFQKKFSKKSVNFSKKQEFINRRILEEVSEGYGPHFETGWGYIAEEKFVEAEGLFRNALHDFPDDVNAYINLAFCLAFAGKLEDSEQIIKQGLIKFPENLILYHSLGQIYIFHQRWKDAISVLVKAQALDVDNNDIDMALGWSYLKDGDSQKAELLYKKSVERYKNYDFYKAMKLFYEMQNDTQLANEYSIKSKKAKVGSYNPVTKYNYNILKEKVLKSHIKFVSVQYPRREIGLLKRLLENDKGIIFVDNEALFDSAVAKEGYDAIFIDNFAGDFGHCTVEGNRLLAQNIAEAILRNF